MHEMEMDEIGPTKIRVSLDQMMGRIEEILHGQPSMGLAQGALDEDSSPMTLGDDLHVGIITESIPDEHRGLDIVVSTQRLVEVVAIVALAEEVASIELEDFHGRRRYWK